MKLKEKVVVVTGASSGMGKAIVELFAAEGARVVAVARRTDKLEELRQELAGAPGEVIPFAGDVSLRATNDGMIDLAVEKFGRLDILVNNAGIMDDMGPVGELTDEKYAQVMQVNTYGPMCAMRRAVGQMTAQGGGVIVNIASLGGLRTCAGAAYCASKAAVISLTKNTAYMYAPQGIRCNAIAPGGINTNISASMGMPNMFGYGRVKNVMATMPGMGEAEDIARAALFLACDDSRFVNGDVMIVDGGWNAG